MRKISSEWNRTLFLFHSLPKEQKIIRGTRLNGHSRKTKSKEKTKRKGIS